MNSYYHYARHYSDCVSGCLCAIAHHRYPAQGGSDVFEDVLTLLPIPTG